jgi:hypothetical protein
MIGEGRSDKDNDPVDFELLHLVCVILILRGRILQGRCFGSQTNQ